MISPSSSAVSVRYVSHLVHCRRTTGSTQNILANQRKIAMLASTKKTVAATPLKFMEGV